MLLLKFLSTLDICAFYGQMVVSLCLNVLTFDNLNVLSCALVISKVVLSGSVVHFVMGSWLLQSL